MGNKAEYSTSIRSKQAIQKAFFTLLETNPINKITVSKIVELAGINRGTFYAHYEDLNFLITSIGKTMADELINILLPFEQTVEKSTLEDMILKLNNAIKNNEEIYRKLINTDIATFVIKKLIDVFSESQINFTTVSQEKKNSLDFKIRLNFYAGGIAKVYIAYLTNELSCNIDDIPDIINKIIIDSSILL